ncbi:hypothetical protein EV700_3350 [Fluviicoccus keumensis]|uniref:Acetyltransferase (GNAT) family protein n=1 Tax=Fluviicoccus keumensis TaxID=1435465 RepID=A0A4Q7YDM3_9GAMM|nr:hypothetical protein [Fluviicoccus keumensis]RZU35397.1 hypothetical protein EV700_3350 [Fluviicoccus keumensis]
MELSHSREALKASYYPLSRISVIDIRQMYAVYSRYYERTDWDLFLRDLSKKTGAFLIRRKSDNLIVGFSTIVSSDMVIRGKKSRGVFSGDTIIERAYWGSRVLQIAFTKFMLAEKIRYPRQPIYWLLISKGFKTYLLLANNFLEFYPNPRGNHGDDLSDVVDTYCNEMFPEFYDREKRILDFGQDYQCLKGDVAEITDEMRLSTPAIRFFEERNPEWRRGTELPCVGVFDWKALANYAYVFANKAASKGREDARRAAEAAAAVPRLHAVDAPGANTFQLRRSA